MSADPVLACAGLGAAYDGREIFSALDCALAPGIHALRGANEIGKSTLLRLLAGAQQADAGQVWIDGIDLARSPEDAKRRLSYMPDESPINPFMTGEELLHFVSTVKRAAIGVTVEKLIAAFDLSRYLRALFDAMSLRIRKKMLLCAALIGAPRVLLLDEPSNGLDFWSRDHLVNLLRDWKHRSVILFSAHDEEFVAACGASVVEMRSLLTSAGSGIASIPAPTRRAK